MDYQFIIISSIQCLLFIICSFYNTLCNANPYVGKSVEPAGKDEFPFVVSFSRKIHFGGEVNHFCGGSLISKIHVLTSAHCFENQTISNIVINIGSNTVGSGDRYEVKSWMTYNKWVKRNCIICAYFVNDVMIVTLTEEVENIKPAKISFSKDKHYYGKSAVSIGWGKGNDGKIQKYLQKVYLKVLSMKECNKQLYNVYKEDLEVPYNYLCTIGNPLVTMGGGDSGGPLMDPDTKEIIGINDSNCIKPETRHCHSVNLHASIDYYRHFIKNYITKFGHETV